MMRSTTLIVLLALLASACSKANDAGTPSAASAHTPAQSQTPAQTPAPSPAPSSEVLRPELAAHFKNFPASTFVLYDQKRNAYVRHNPARAAERFPPFSTFKIPNSLIGLETGVIADADFLIKWDAEKYPRPEGGGLNAEWWRDQTLRTAFQRSAVWYYQELAKRVGEARMKEFVTKFRYGNEDISGGIDRFWLASSLKISADEQVEFLRRLHGGELPVSKRALDIVRDIMTHEQTPSYKLSAKTGSGPVEGRGWLGWFVGFLETGDNTYFFATQIEGPDFDSIRAERINVTKRILKDLGHMKAEARP